MIATRRGRHRELAPGSGLASIRCDLAPGVYSFAVDPWARRLRVGFRGRFAHPNFDAAAYSGRPPWPSLLGSPAALEEVSRKDRDFWLSGAQGASPGVEWSTKDDV